MLSTEIQTDFRENYFSLVSSITCLFLAQQFITMHEFSCLQFQMTLWMCNWIFPPPFIGPEFLQFLVEEMVSFPFFPLPDPWCAWFVTRAEPSDQMEFAWATPSCSSIPSCIFFPLTLKCFYHLLCLQLLFRASLLYSVFHSTDIITSKLTNFLFTIVDNVILLTWSLTSDYLLLPCLC